MPINWQDGSAGGTPLSAANLNRLAVVADIGTAGTPTGDAVKAAAAAQVTDGAISQLVTSGATTTAALKAAYVAVGLGASSVQATAAQRVTGDTDVFVRTGGTANASEIGSTDRSRQILVVANGTSDTLNVAEGTLDSDAIPGTFTAVPPGNEYVTTSARPVFAYFSATDGYVRLYTQIGA